MTKRGFLGAYEADVALRYAWAADAERRAKFIDSVRITLAGPATTWNFDGPSTIAAWRAIGGKGKPTLKALRALPDGLCPVCGEPVKLTGYTTDRRMIASCGDAFTEPQWATP